MDARWPPNNSHLWKLIIGDEREVQRVDLYQIIHLAAQVTPGRESIIVRPPVRVGRVLEGPWCGRGGKLETQRGRTTGPSSYNSP